MECFDGKLGHHSFLPSKQTLTHTHSLYSKQPHTHTHTHTHTTHTHMHTRTHACARTHTYTLNCVSLDLTPYSDHTISQQITGSNMRMSLYNQHGGPCYSLFTVCTHLHTSLSWKWPDHTHTHTHASTSTHVHTHSACFSLEFSFHTLDVCSAKPTNQKAEICR